MASHYKHTVANFFNSQKRVRDKNFNSSIDHNLEKE